MTTPRYSVIYADPPWQYDDRACNDEWRGTPYETLSLAQLTALPVHLLAADDCALFMWGTYPLVAESLAVISGWGFEFKTLAFQWVKTNPKAGTPFYGLGRWTRGNTEPCWLGVRGKPARLDKGVAQLVEAPDAPEAEYEEVIRSPMRRHSAKPPEVRDRIMRLMGDVPRIELFARERAEGWAQTGLELDGLDIRETLKAVAWAQARATV